MENEIKAEFQEYIISSVENLLLLQMTKDFVVKKLDDKIFLQALSQEGILILSAFFCMYINNVLLEILKLTDFHKKDDDYSFRYWLSEYSKYFSINVENDVGILKSIYTKYKKIRNKYIAHLTKERICMGDFPKILEIDDCIENIKRLVIKYGELMNCDLNRLNVKEADIKDFLADVDLTTSALDVKKLFYCIS